MGSDSLVPSTKTLKELQTIALDNLTQHPDVFVQLLVVGIAKGLVTHNLKSSLAVKGLSFRSFPLVDILTMLAKNVPLFSSELKRLLRVGPEAYARRVLHALTKP